MRASTNAVDLWNKFGTSLELDAALQKDIAEEFASSVVWQTHSFENPPRAPSINSPSIDWEQSIVEGHPTHPVGSAN